MLVCCVCGRASQPQAGMSNRLVERPCSFWMFYRSNCHRYDFPALFLICVFFSSPFYCVFFYFPANCHCPVAACGVGENVRGSFKMRSTRAKEIMEPRKNDGMPPRPKLPHCRSVPWPTTSMGKRAKEGGAARMGGKITLLPTHLASTVPHQRYQFRGWLAGHRTEYLPAQVSTCLRT